MLVVLALFGISYCKNKIDNKSVLLMFWRLVQWENFVNLIINYVNNILWLCINNTENLSWDNKNLSNVLSSLFQFLVKLLNSDLILEIVRVFNCWYLVDWGSMINLLVVIITFLSKLFLSKTLSKMSGVVEPFSYLKTWWESGKTYMEDLSMLRNIDAS